MHHSPLAMHESRTSRRSKHSIWLCWKVRTITALVFPTVALLACASRSIEFPTVDRLSAPTGTSSTVAPSLPSALPAALSTPTPPSETAVYLIPSAHYPERLAARFFAALTNSSDDEVQGLLTEGATLGRTASTQRRPAALELLSLMKNHGQSVHLSVGASSFPHYERIEIIQVEQFRDDFGWITVNVRGPEPLGGRWMLRYEVTAPRGQISEIIIPNYR